MRVPLEWLADYVDVDLPVDDLAHRLTMAGLKVESVERVGTQWQDVIIGQVAELEPHPKSNKPLWVAKVNLGGRTITVVTGAQNVRAGDKVPVVLVGGILPHGPDGNPMIIQAKPMAGITSEGMLASELELGISEEHAGIYILPADVPVGEHLRSVMGGDVIEIETNPNRPDTLSIIGIAREVAAVTEQQLTLPDLDAITGPVEWLDEESFAVEVEDLDLCPRYSALRIEGVGVGASPAWLAGRLEAAGMRPINLLVDITNYVMLEYGQPMHAFDLRHLHGGRIVVRRGKQGEHLRTLDGVDRMLSAEDLVIADGGRAVAIAGVMGGEESEIGPETSAIVLESANFNPVSVRRTAQRLNMRTEASSRFEKGLPPEQTVPALMRYLQILAQISGERREERAAGEGTHKGMPLRGESNEGGVLRVARVSDVWVGPPAPRTVSMPMRDLHRLLGISVSAERAAEALSLLGFDVVVGEGTIDAVVPFWRRADIELSADLVEEVGRIIGFDDIPSTLPHHTMPPPAPLPDLRWEAEVREQLMSAGASEIVTATLTSPAAMAKLYHGEQNGHDLESPDLWAKLVVNPAGVYQHEALTLPLHLKNPPTRDRTTLRLSLVPSVLAVVERNVKHTEERLSFFEIGRTYFKRREDLPYERRTLGLALAGRRRPRSWQEPSPASYSFYDLKGMLVAVLEALDIQGWQVEPAAHPALHPGRSASIRLMGHDVAYLGELHPGVAAAYGIEEWPVQVAEVDLDTLFSAASDARVFRPLPRYPAALRDIAVLVGRDVPAAEIMRVIRKAGGDLLESAELFDVYEGGSLPAGKKSIAASMAFRSPGATLTQDEVGAVMNRIVASLREALGAELRD